MLQRARGVTGGEPGESTGWSQLNLSGDFDQLLGTGPCFRGTLLRGYDRLQVDNYVAWAENELFVVRRENQDLVARFGAYLAEVQAAYRQAPPAAPARDLGPVSDRVAEILELAKEEAADRLAVAADEAERIRADARLETEARLANVHTLREAAVAAVSQAEETARRLREEAAEAVEMARVEARRLLKEAAADRERLAAEAELERDRLAAEAAELRERLALAAAKERDRAFMAAADRLAQEEERARRARETADAEASARLAAVQAEVDDLRAQRDEARDSLRRLTALIGEALQAVVAGVGPEDRTVLSPVTTLPHPVAS